MHLIQALALLVVCFHSGVFAASEWEALGCFKDGHSRTMPHFLGKVHYNPSNPGYKLMFDQCRKKAEDHGYTYFGVQNMKECWGSKNAMETYDDLGCDDYCRVDDEGYGTGGKWLNFVYRVKKDWTECSRDVCLQYEIVLKKLYGAKCPEYNKEVYVDKEITKPCENKDKCVVDGGWSDFSHWSDCTKTCGGGTKERTRSCTNPAPSFDGKDCEGVAKETKACNSEPCRPRLSYLTSNGPSIQCYQCIGKDCTATSNCSSRFDACAFVHIHGEAYARFCSTKDKCDEAAFECEKTKECAVKCCQTDLCNKEGPMAHPSGGATIIGSKAFIAVPLVVGILSYFIMS
ncbi:A disintegrin and metalloproteinase with thrombospondin motifs adt-2-like [Actinia tenebrosa]|uniref:A disintegrin and metalloproteinase with thrombospondin motifs adt-2-like n=1 Tax=Actinia tenebrosa TaxID=6105 RepID=A0A6P8H0I0_ACTTE|nr:A disintegrin and metalloproteinase with thrombospondin motifs adt-2-like [Actinia tenebrosa]